MPITWILLNRRPFINTRMRAARAVIFACAGFACAMFGQSLAGSYFDPATRIAGAFGAVVYGGQVGTILLALGVVLLWEAVRS